MTTTTTTSATRKEWIGLAVIALPCMLYSMDLTVLNLAVPQITADLKPSAAQLLWIIDIYGFMVAGFLLTMGTLGDRIGRRKLLMIGAAAFGAASVPAAFSQSAEMLIACRALLGIAGATLAPSTLSLLTHMFTDPKERNFAISMWIMSFSLGGILGPLIGGFFITQFWWGAALLIGAPVMLLLLALAPFLLPEYKDPDPGRLDFISVGLSLAAVLSFIYGVKRAAESGMGAGAALAMLSGLAIALVFARRQLALANPLFDLKLFRAPAFAAAFAINLCGFFFMFGCFTFMAQYFQLVKGLTPFEAGLWNLPSAIAFTGASMLSPMISSRMRPAHLMATGMAVAALGFLMLAFADDLIAVAAASVIFSAGFTPVVTQTTGLIVGAAPPERAGAASAISETGAELGGSLGIALLGSLCAFVYRSRMSIAAPDASAGAHATLSGAVEQAALMPGEAGAALLAAGRTAFMAGFHLTALLTAAALITLALVCLAVLRNFNPGPSGGQP